MRVLLRPVLVPELGLVVLKPGRESIQIFHNPRVLVEPEPKSMRNLPSGVVPAVRQPLAEDKTLLPFFSNERVIRAAGGVGALSDWLLRHVTSCQWPNGDYHHTETVIHRYGTGAMVLCWHCDNQLRDQTSESLELLAQQNLTAWVIDVIRHAISGTQERELSLAELSWWAVCNQVVDALPEAVSRRSLGLPAEKICSVYRESDIVPGEQTATSILKQRTKNLAPLPYAHQQQKSPQEKTVVSITVDPESPESFMKLPKRRRWVKEKYTRWVKTQPCACCGMPADDPHHLIGHGQGGMGTKAHDLFVLPLCRKHHNELHTDIAPPDIPAGFVAVFNSDKASWHLDEDHRGKTVYDVASGDALFISELGPLPENVTWLSPEGEFQKWNGTAWVKDAEAEKLFRIREAEETKNSLMQVASEHIAPLQDAVDLEIATEEETSLLEAWKKYRVLLNRVDTSTAQDIEWPALP